MDLYQLAAAHLTVLCPSAASITAATSQAEAEQHPLGPVATVLVVPSAETWSAPRDAGLVVSAAGSLRFACVVGLTYPAGHSEWSQIRAEIRAALLGWTPDLPEAAAPVHAAGGRLLAYSADEGGRWLHAFDFILPVQASYEHQS